MERYTGQPLPSNARIALLANDALGNFAICTSLAQAFQHSYPDCRIDFYGGERTKELECASDLFAWRTSVQGRQYAAVLSDAISRVREVDGYDLAMNIEAGQYAAKALAAAFGKVGYVCGPCLDPESRGDWEYPADERGDLWRDKEWASPDVIKRHPLLLCGFIGEIFLHLAYLKPLNVGESEWPRIPKYRFPTEEPPFDTSPVLISTGASLPDKIWPVEKWRTVLQWLRGRGNEVGLIGALRKRQQQFYHSADDEQVLVDEGLVIDLRGKLTLPQVVGALSNATLVVTLDNGILHFAAATDVPTIGLYRNGIAGLWAPPTGYLEVIESDDGPVSSIEVDTVLQACATSIK